ncbi:cysteine desulfurase family protein [Puia sp. P3]|uniref:cysteine desulfurase family protein n=1 Tax=Puia sp. P3 TaxID=3423952 RepID=UPI003D666823
MPVDAEGLIDLQQLEDAIRPTTILIAVMYANNEIGVLQPIPAVSNIARKHGVLFFTDATQAVGKVPVDVNKDGIDLLTLSAHKLYGPKGIGALYVRRRNPRVRLTAQMDGGGHEKGMRSGTLNVPAIVGLGRAAALCAAEMQKDATHTASLRDRLESGILAIEGAHINGSRTHRLPQTTNISFSHIDGQALWRDSARISPFPPAPPAPPPPWNPAMCSRRWASATTWPIAASASDSAAGPPKRKLTTRSKESATK